MINSLIIIYVAILEKQDQYDSDVSHLRQTIVDLENQCVKLSGKRTGPLGQADRYIQLC